MKTELWRIGILRGDIATIALSPASIDNTITWLPEQRPFSFLADPFALWQEDKLHVLAEHFDYRTKHGVIRYYTYGRDFVLEDEGEALRHDVHLSYPFLIRDGADIYMIPEAHRSGGIRLYRARRFPQSWEPVGDILPVPGVDPSVVHHDGLWWMAYARPRGRGETSDQLHLAFAEKLTGPWRAHPKNPVRVSADSARPGGTPFMAGGRLHFPMQDSRSSYGDAVGILRVETLTPEDVVLEPVRRLAPGALGLDFAGLHTLSGAGAVTLIDLKSYSPSPARSLVNLQRRLFRLRRRVFG
jgi:hypothetical protein